MENPGGENAQAQLTSSGSTVCAQRSQQPSREFARAKWSAFENERVSFKLSQLFLCFRYGLFFFCVCVLEKMRGEEVKRGKQEPGLFAQSRSRATPEPGGP